MLDKDYWVVTGYMTLRTIAQAALALIGTDAVGVTDVDWIGVASASVLAGILCVLMRVATAPLGSNGAE